MSDHLLKMCGLTKDQVQSMMQTKVAKHPSRNAGFLKDKLSRLKCAYETIKTGTRIDKAAMAWNVSVNDVMMYAKRNRLTAPIDLPGVVPECKSYKGWFLSQSIGVSKAARELGITRRSIYGFAKRYNLPTPFQK
jgi:hypothetical protein